MEAMGNGCKKNKLFASLQLFILSEGGSLNVSVSTCLKTDSLAAPVLALLWSHLAEIYASSMKMFLDLNSGCGSILPGSSRFAASLSYVPANTDFSLWFVPAVSVLSS